MAVTKADLLKQRFGQEPIEIPGVGEVRIRALSRAEALELQGVELPVAEMERKLLSLALVEPKLTEAEVGEWQAASPAGELQPVVTAITRLSGLEPTAAKEAVKSFRD